MSSLVAVTLALAQAAAPPVDRPPPASAAAPAAPQAHPSLALAAASPPTSAPQSFVSAPPATPPSPPSPPFIWTVPLAHTAGVMTGMRLSLSVLWPEPYNPFPLARSRAQFRRAFTEAPEFDGDRALIESDNDPWFINVVGHGLFGAELYGRARQCHAGPLGALAFAAAGSALWEYGIESFNKRPSAVDLVLTPALGAALGEGRHQLQRWLRTRPRTRWTRTLEWIIDPLGEGERTLLHTRC